MTLEEQISAAEAVLFASGEPVRIDALLEALEIPPEEFEPVLRGLALRYGEGRGVRLMRYEDSLQLCTRPQYREILEKVLQPVRKQTLTQAALETLAVVAYRQPITRMEVEQIRGVQCDRAMATLVHWGLIEECGRKDTVGRPILYGTTEKFLQHFALSSLDELPKLTPVETEGDDFLDFGGV
ncbi:MAG: SMC-Scp complex subunit ScpB [Candidatus Spyradocola sp.]